MPGQQQPGAAAPAGLAAALGIFPIVLALLVYVYLCVCLMVIAQKTGTDGAWMAWVPILNLVLLCEIADKPVWWVLLLFLPIVDIVIYILLWMGAAEERGKPSWVGVLMIVPVANLIVPGYLAFTDGTSSL